MKEKIRLTYVSDKHYLRLEYLTKLCDEIDMTKTDILRLAFERLFTRIEPFKRLLSTEKFKEYEAEFLKARLKATKKLSVK